jgi:CO dehydrogenase/acetyl-CoA synthase beta subunit
LYYTSCSEHHNIHLEEEEEEEEEEEDRQTQSVLIPKTEDVPGFREQAFQLHKTICNCHDYF